MKIFLLSLAILAFALQNSVETKSVFSLTETEILEPEDFNGTDHSFRRIFGGNTARVGQFPWQAYLLTKSQAKRNGIPINKGISECGASLISAQHLITAAHCLRYYDSEKQLEYVAQKVNVRLGGVTKTRDGIEIVTQRYLIHSTWNIRDNSLKNDIAIIYLPSPVQFNRKISPISLPTSVESYSDEYATASGFGMTTPFDEQNQVLKSVPLKVLSTQACRKQISGVDNSQVCTSNLDIFGRPNVGACRGDSGGPLVVKRGNKNILIGVTSFAIFTGSLPLCDSHPTVFTRISYFLSFIRKSMSNV